jgi:predicted permease
MNGFLQDLGYSVRGLAKSRAFTLTAILTLTVCIGANVALFAVVYHVLLRPLRVPDADRIVLIYNSYPKAGADHAAASVPDYFERRHYMTVFEEQALFNVRNPSVDVNGVPQRIEAMQVTPSFFRVIQTSPQLGRGFTEDEGEIGRNHVIILSHGLSRAIFGEREALGQTVRIDGEPRTVVGVMPANFVFVASKVQAWLPLVFSEQEKTYRYNSNWAYLGRLKTGATVAQAQAEVDALNAANLTRFPEEASILTGVGFRSVAVRFQDDLVRDVRSTMYLVWGGALCVLLIGCVNVASLILVRFRGRLRELATRMALGAGRKRIMFQLVSETVLLTTVSGVAGLLIGDIALRLFGAANLEQLPGGTEVNLDVAVIIYAMVAATVIGIVLGIVPALAGVSMHVTQALRDGGRSGTAGRGTHAVRRLLVVTQMALAFVLLVGAGLLFASFRHLLTIDPGFNPHGVLTASVNLPPARYANGSAVRGFTGNALNALRSVPGVVAVGATSSIPFATGYDQGILLPEGYRDKSVIASYLSDVTPGYFEAMHARLVSGRFFDARDSSTAPNVVIVDERLAKRYWPTMDPIGRRMYEPSDTKDLLAVTTKTEWWTVVGVVKEVKLRGLVEGVGSTGAIYRPLAQRWNRSLTFALRTSGDPLSVANVVQKTITELDPELPIFDVQTMVERTDRSLVTRRSAMVLATTFGMVALSLAAIGIYGVLAYAVTQRTKEIGVRMALGSTTTAIFRLIVREGVGLILVGFLFGTLGAIAVKQTLESQLVGISFTDPLILMSATGLLVLVALLACAIPARRAARVDPLVALRYE